MNNRQVSLVSANRVSNHAWYFVPVFSHQGVRRQFDYVGSKVAYFPHLLPTEQYHKRGVIDTRRACVEKRMYLEKRYIFGELILALVGLFFPSRVMCVWVGGSFQEHSFEDVKCGLQHNIYKHTIRCGII